MRIREADLKAKVLVVAVESVLSKVRAMAMQLEMELGGANGAANYDTVDSAAFDLTTMALVEWGGVMRGLGLALDMSPIAPPIPDSYLDGLKRIVLLNHEFKRGPIQSRYLLENSESLMQAAVDSMRSDAPAAPPFVRSDADERISTLEGVVKPDQALVPESPKATRQPPSVEKFSEAANAYIATRIEANRGNESGDIHSIRFRASLFVELVGDRPLNEYGQTDLQAFLNKLQYLPPKREIPELKGKSFSQMIAMNAKHAYGVLALNTVKGHYLNDVKTIADFGASKAKIENPFARVKLIFPKVFALPKRHRASSSSKISTAFLHGLSSGKLHKAMMLPLGFFTGRRLGLLTSISGHNIRRVGEFVVVKLDQHRRVVDGSLDLNAFKTADSLDGFILHDFFDKIGFVDWAMKQSGPLFPKIAKWKDPEDAMQKAMNKVLKEAHTGGTYHGFRGLCITAMRTAGVSDYSRRVQSGHAPIDEHEEYGDLPVAPDDAPKLAHLKYPDGFDIQPFMGLDFDAMARR